MDTIADMYFVKAKDSYPHNLGESVESLTYALSYDREHVGANHLMGIFCAEQLNDLARAESYFQVAMASDPCNKSVCLDYIQIFIFMKEFGKAEKLIEYTWDLKGVDLAILFHHIGLIHEYNHEYDKALKSYGDAMLESYNDELSCYLDSVIRRVRAKQKLKKNPSSK